MLGSKLKIERLNMKWSQKELANKLNVAVSTVSMYERNERKPDYDLLIKIANLFNVSVDYLLDNESGSFDITAEHFRFSLGNRIKNLRESCGFTQKIVSKSLNLSIYQLSRYENGLSNPDPEMIVSIANYFDVTTDYLLGIDIRKTSTKSTTEICHGNYSLKTTSYLKLLSGISDSDRDDFEERVIHYANYLKSTLK